MKKRCMAIMIFTLVGCESSMDKNQSQANQTTSPIQECSIYDSRRWQASMGSLNGTDNKYEISVGGEVDLPSPAYQVIWKQGPLDRAYPPSLRLRLITNNDSEGASIQVITSTRTKYTIETSVPNIKQVIIACGDEVIATVPVVSAEN